MREIRSAPVHALGVNQVLLRDLSLHFGVKDLTEWLENEANTLAELGFRNSAEVRFTKELKEARNILKIVPGNVSGEKASLSVEAGRYVIRYREELPLDRRRFSIAHEIGHTYWFAPDDPGRPIVGHQSLPSSAEAIEALCDSFAAALLLPRRQVLQLVGEELNATTPALHLIPRVARRFEVADRCATRRLFSELSRRDIAIIRLRQSHHRGDGEQVRWRLSWSMVPAALEQAHSLEGVRVPLLVKSRVIPDDMVPCNVPIGENCRVVELDGRWFEGLYPHNNKQATRAFGNRRPSSRRMGFAFRHLPAAQRDVFDRGLGGDVLYVAIPLA